MNVLLANPYELEATGGVTVVVRTLGDHFLLHGDHPVHLISGYRKNPAKDHAGGVPVYRVNLRPPVIAAHPLRSRIAFLLFYLPTCWRLAQIVRRERIEVVNIHYYDRCWNYFLFLKRFLDFRLVISVHGSDVLGALGPENVRWLNRKSSRLDRVLFCSEGFRRQTLPPAAALNKRSAVVLNGIDLRDLSAVSKPRKGSDSIVCVAHLREHKGQDVLLRAFRELSEEFPTLTLRFVGHGPCASALESLTRDLNLGDRVRFLGELPRDETLAEIASARIFCLPSRREPFGLVLLEAMALGVPVVGSRVGGIPEIIRSGIDGLLVEPDSPSQLAASLRLALRDETLRLSLIREGRVRVESCFTVARFFSDYRQLFASLVSSHQPAGRRTS
jgi:glycosyltransferase involved in cell wall biosynthesis